MLSSWGVLYLTTQKSDEMIDSIFNNVSNEEYAELRHAIPLITILVAGADGQIDDDELAWAEKVRNIRSYNLPDKLRDFYQHVGTDYAEILQAIIDNYPKETAARQEKIAVELSSLNSILPKMTPEYGYELYQSYRSFAKHVAKASGGFLGFGKIGPQEKIWMQLEMITPIEEPNDEA